MNTVTIILLIALIVIALVFLIKSKLTKLVASSLRVGFIFFFILALIGIFLPSAYDFGADLILKQTGIYSQLVKIDQDIPVQNLIDTPGNIFDFLTGGKKDEEKQEVGFFENSLYPTFVSIFSFMIRIYSLIVSFGGLTAVVYLSYLSTTITDTENLKSKVRKLEERIATLESR